MFESLTIVMIIMGMAFVFLSYYINEQNEDNSEKAIEEYEEFQLKLKEINDKMLELNDYSEFIKKEIEAKHNELLFLYHVISEKSKMLEDSKEQKEKEDVLSDKIDLSKKEVLQSIEITEVQYNSVEQSKKILELYQSGLDIIEIAKTLGIGQGEVSLTLNLFK